MDTYTFKPMRPYSIQLALTLAEMLSRAWIKRVPSRQGMARNMIASSRPTAACPSPAQTGDP
jgi:hypothetical protein